MKPHEVWIPDDIVERLKKVPIAPMLRSSKFREVVPINWEKVWKAYWEWHGSMKNENMYVDKIQELVEKALAGEE